jgi:hypothetical protein
MFEVRQNVVMFFLQLSARLSQYENGKSCRESFGFSFVSSLCFYAFINDVDWQKTLASSRKRLSDLRTVPGIVVACKKRYAFRICENNKSFPLDMI